jgi:hypothetical protein
MRTSKKDVNYFSISQNQCEYFSGSGAAQPGQVPTPPVFSPLYPLDYDAILKISNSTDIILNDVEVAQGRENSVDCNNYARNSSVSGLFGVGGEKGDQVFTIKGGSNNLKFAGTIFSSGKKAHIVIGEWSDQSFETSYNIDLSELKTHDGSPVTVIVSRVNNPILSAFGKSKDIKFPANFKVLTTISLLEQAYWWIKLFFVKTGIIKYIKI